MFKKEKKPNYGTTRVIKFKVLPSEEAEKFLNYTMFQLLIIYNGLIKQMRYINDRTPKTIKSITYIEREEKEKKEDTESENLEKKKKKLNSDQLHAKKEKIKFEIIQLEEIIENLIKDPINANLVEENKIKLEELIKERDKIVAKYKYDYHYFFNFTKTNKDSEDTKVGFSDVLNQLRSEASKIKIENVPYEAIECIVGRFYKSWTRCLDDWSKGIRRNEPKYKRNIDHFYLRGRSYSPRMHWNNNTLRFLKKDGQSSIPGYFYCYEKPNIPDNAIIKNIGFVKGITGYYITLTCENLPRRIGEKTGKSIGIDLGVTRMCAFSDGSFIENPRTYQENKRLLRILDRSLSRKIEVLKRQHEEKYKDKNKEDIPKFRLKNYKTSTRFKRDRLLRAKLFLKMRRQRNYLIECITTEIVEKYDFIAVEDLNISNMTRSAKGNKKKPGKNVKQKAGLNREMLDLGFGYFLLRTEQKAIERDKIFIRVNPRYSSQQCSKCGYTDKANRVAQAVFVCLNCGSSYHADTNASINILERGLKLYEENLKLLDKNKVK